MDGYRDAGGGWHDATPETWRTRLGRAGDVLEPAFLMYWFLALLCGVSG